MLANHEKEREKRKTCADPEGDKGPDLHLKNHKFIGFPSTCNSGPDPLIITKLPSHEQFIHLT